MRDCRWWGNSVLLKHCLVPEGPDVYSRAAPPQDRAPAERDVSFTAATFGSAGAVIDF